MKWKNEADFVSQFSNLNELAQTCLVPELRGPIFFFSKPISLKR